MGQSLWSKHEVNRNSDSSDDSTDDNNKEPRPYIVNDEMIADVTRKYHEREMMIGSWNKSKVGHKSVFICYFSEKYDKLIGRAFSIELFYDDCKKKSVLSIKGPIYNTTARKYKCEKLYVIHCNIHYLIKIAKITIEQHGEYGYWRNNCRHFCDNFMQNVKATCMITSTNLKQSVVNKYVTKYVEGDEFMVEYSMNRPLIANTWPKDIFLNETYAKTFACISCAEIPKGCETDNAGQIYCGYNCYYSVEKSRSRKELKENKAVQNMISKLKVRCRNQLEGREELKSNTFSVLAGNIVDTEDSKEGETCNWKGILKDLVKHESVCPDAVIRCASNGCLFEGKRTVMDKHRIVCPFMIIDCSLDCGMELLRQDMDSHLVYYCAEKVLNCSNDGCQIQLKRRLQRKHVEKECKFTNKSNNYGLVRKNRNNDDSNENCAV
eukprot:515847_1